MMPTLVLVKHRLPPSWDGAPVKWDRFEETIDVRICPPPKHAERCGCGSVEKPLIAKGVRDPLPGEMFASTKQKRGRHGTLMTLPVTVPAWPVFDLIAFHCPTCNTDEVWDMRSNEWWILDTEDYGPTGSTRPIEREWSGGLFDHLPPTETHTTKPTPTTTALAVASDTPSRDV